MIGLIGCSAQKLDRPAPARELYCSALFRKSLAYAGQRCERVYVLSGKHGLVDLDAVIEPYNTRLRFGWGFGRQIARELISRHGIEVDYLLLAGLAYADALATAMSRADCHRGDQPLVPTHRIHQPLAGMQIGQRLRWLNEQARRAEAA